MTEIVSGQDLIDAGMQQGKWFAPALAAANAVLEKGGSHEDAIETARSFAPPPAMPLHASGALPLHLNIQAENPHEAANVEAVTRSMIELMRTPVVRAGAIMPDACPAGSPGTIPVGGVAVSEGIHPGMHSADICCSMAISVFPGVAPAALLDAVHAVTHFGPGGRQRGQQFRPSAELFERFEANALLRDLKSAAIEHFGTQGDGNHFAYVGTLKSSGETALVTHHGSRAPGARLYAKGMRIAEGVRRTLSPETLPQNAWIPADTPMSIGRLCRRSANGPRATTCSSTIWLPKSCRRRSRTGSGTSTTSSSAVLTGCSTTARAPRRPSTTGLTTRPI